MTPCEKHGIRYAGRLCPVCRIIELMDEFVAQCGPFCPETQEDVDRGESQKFTAECAREVIDDALRDASS